MRWKNGWVWCWNRIFLVTWAPSHAFYYLKEMDHQEIRETARQWCKDLVPAILVLAFSLIFQLLWGNHPSTDGWWVVYRVLLRFFRYAVFLCLPLYLVKTTYNSILKKGVRSFVQVEPARVLNVSRIKHWLFRPFQGIGIAFLFATKLLAVIQIISGPSPNSPVPFTPGHFQTGRLFVGIGITIGISLLLSTLWTLDDLGIRYHNRRDQELKMIGKYVGTLMPTIFGLYGVLSLYAQSPGESALNHVFRIIIALYPPMVVFAVVHTHFIRKRIKLFSVGVSLIKGGIWRGQG